MGKLFWLMKKKYLFCELCPETDVAHLKIQDHCDYIFCFLVQDFNPGERNRNF